MCTKSEFRVWIGRARSVAARRHGLNGSMTDVESDRYEAILALHQMSEAQGANGLRGYEI